MNGPGVSTGPTVHKDKPFIRVKHSDVGKGHLERDPVGIVFDPQTSSDHKGGHRVVVLQREGERERREEGSPVGEPDTKVT